MKNHRSGTISIPNEPELQETEVEDLVSHLWENIDGLPCYIQNLLQDSQQPGKVGATSYALVAGWALCKLDYEIGNPWDGTKSGWVPKKNEVN